MPTDPITWLTVTLAALTAFFTLVTGALAVAVTFYVFYAKRQEARKEEEIERLNKLGDALEDKLSEAEEKLQTDGEEEEEYKKTLREIKSAYRNFRNQVVHTPGIRKSLRYEVDDSEPSNAELEDQIQSLLQTISQLQTEVKKEDL